jgi:hypothetical protein
MTIEIQKNIASTVYIHTEETSWALFWFTPAGDLLLSSDWGTYTHRWRGFGDDFEKFLKGLDVEYFVGKLSKQDVNQTRTHEKQKEILRLLFGHFITALKNQEPDKPNIDLKQEIISKANKWDELHEKVGKFYHEENESTKEEEEALLNIGEIAAIKLGYL